jgi:hypothetical protein
LGLKEAASSEECKNLPLFLYGSLMSPKLLSLILFGDENQSNALPSRRQAILEGYRRGTVVGKDYCAVASGTNNDRVLGLLFFPRNMEDREKLNHFEGEQYSPAVVEVICSGQAVRALVYLWSGDKSDVTELPWDLKKFENE